MDLLLNLVIMAKHSNLSDNLDQHTFLKIPQ